MVCKSKIIMVQFTTRLASNVLYLLCTVQDRKPLKDDVEIPQTLQDQAQRQLKLLEAQGDQTEESMAEIIKVAKLNFNLG